MSIKRELYKEDILNLKNYLRASREANGIGEILVKHHVFEALLNMAFKAVEGE